MARPRLRVDVGRRFTRLVVVRVFAGVSHTTCECTCDCGRTHVVTASHLLAGRTKSCGCYAPAYNAIHKRKHGGAINHQRTAEYRAWRHMKSRCLNPRVPSFADYGGRGISICDRWRDNFQAFLDDMGERPSPKHSVDRIDTNGDYEPNNCRWATKLEQANNTRWNRRLILNGESRTIAQWARVINIDASTIQRRLTVGWTVERALHPSLRPSR
jgi:hypothetical protein